MIVKKVKEKNNSINCFIVKVLILCSLKLYYAYVYVRSKHVDKLNPCILYILCKYIYRTRETCTVIRKYNIPLE